MESTTVMDAMAVLESRVCGIDPGLGTTGYAVLSGDCDAPVVIDAGVCRFDQHASLAHRLVAIERDLTAILDEHRPKFVAVEELYSHYKHPRTAILMGHARGVILLVAARIGCEVHSYAATRVKRFLTGNGRATKAQVQHAIQSALGLTDRPEPSDLADALAIGLCCMNDVGRASPELIG